MQIVLFYFSFLLLGGHFTVDLPYSEIENAFENNKPALIISYCENPVLLIVNDAEGVYNHAQAGMVLMDFLKKKPSGVFEYQFQGKEADDDIFSAATYTVGREEFRILFSFSSETPNNIQSIQITK